MQTVTNTQVQDAMRQVGLSQYAGYAPDVAAVLNRGGDVKEYARQRGVTVSDAQVQQFVGILDTEDTTDEGGFDREKAVQVLSDYAKAQGHNADLTPVFIEAGLVDEPEDEVAEEEPTGLSAQIKAAVQEAVAPLVAFARRHGYQD